MAISAGLVSFFVRIALRMAASLTEKQEQMAVGTLIDEREDAVLARAEDGDRSSAMAEAEPPRALNRDVVERADIFPDEIHVTPPRTPAGGRIRGRPRPSPARPRILLHEGLGMQEARMKDAPALGSSTRRFFT
ncbi:hypothetical protein [Methylocella sp.]|uniref:hypothetical protein n=1 Tax=Methylocella sp. TaxID=1978226 RepID=UPI003C158C64